jgi:hypothetical protein
MTQPYRDSGETGADRALSGLDRAQQQRFPEEPEGATERANTPEKDAESDKAMTRDEGWAQGRTQESFEDRIPARPTSGGLLHQAQKSATACCQTRLFCRP